MKNILVTGGAGFIGSHLVEKLLKNNKDKVTILDNFSTGRKNNLKNFEKNKRLKIVKVDISKISSIKKFFRKIDIVYHIAGLADIVPSIEKPQQYYESNVTGSFNVIKLCIDNNIKKLVYTASSSCYGIPLKYPTNEKEKIDTQYPYALTKYLGEELVLNLGKIYKINVTSLRLFNVYGPKSRTSGTYGAVFGTFLAQKLANKPFTVVGNGNQKRDFVFVSDVVDALISASKLKKTNQVFNIGYGKCYSINYIVKLLNGEKIFIPKRPGEPDCTLSNITKAKKLLNWKPKITIEEGVSILLKNIDYWKNAPVWNEKKIQKATKKWFEYLDK